MYGPSPYAAASSSYPVADGYAPSNPTAPYASSPPLYAQSPQYAVPPRHVDPALLQTVPSSTFSEPQHPQTHERPAWLGSGLHALNEGLGLEYVSGSAPKGLSGSADLLDINPEIRPSASEVAALPLMCSAATLEEHFGSGIPLYFFCLKYMLFTNVLMSILALIVWVPHQIRIASASDSKFRINDLYLASFSVQWEWILYKVVYVILVICIFCFGPLYVASVKSFFRSRGTYDVKEQREVIIENAHTSTASRVFRLFITYTIFAGMLVAVYFATRFFTQQQIQYPLGTDSKTMNKTRIFFAVCVSVALYVINLVWYTLCFKLTEYERLATVTQVRKHNAVKLVLFKILSLLVVVRTQSEVVYDNLTVACIPDEVNKCLLDVLAGQFLILILLDMTVFNVLEMAWPIVLGCLPRRCQAALSDSDDQDDLRPEFDVSVEILEVVYRQYFLYLGFGVFPMIAVLGVVANGLELILDRFRLLRLSKPPVLKGSLKNTVAFFLMLIAIAFMLSPPRLTDQSDGGFFWKPCSCPTR